MEGVMRALGKKKHQWSYLAMEPATVLIYKQDMPVGTIMAWV